MKSTCLVMVAAFLTTLVFGAENTFPDTGNAGVGILSPSVPLHVEKSSPSNYVMRIVNTSGTGYGLYIRNGNDNQNALSINNAADSLSNHVFFGNGNAYLAINGGRLGIGTNSASTVAHVKGTDAAAGATQLTLEGVANGYGAGIDFVSRNTQAPSYLQSMGKITADGEGPWNASGSAGLRFYTTGAGVSSEKVRILGNGNVGIGTIAPTAKLDVNGEVKATVVTTSTFSAASIATNSLNVNGAMQIKRTTFTTNYTVLTTDYLVAFTGVLPGPTSTVNINLPSAASVPAGRVFIFKDETGTPDGLNKKLQVRPSGTDTLESGATFSNPGQIHQYECITLYSNGSNRWFILATR